MLINHIKIACRHLFKQKGHTCISLFGLSVGMACSILIVLFILNEARYDHFHEKIDRIYSVIIQERQADGALQYRRLIPLKVPEAMGEAFPGIERIVQLVSGDVTLDRDGQAFREEIFEADASFFEIFSFPLLAGAPNTALTRPDDMVISETAAQKYFGVDTQEGYQAVIGKTLSIRTSDGLMPFRISGVMADCPDNSSLQISVLISFLNYPTLSLGSNDVDGRTSTYLLLDENQDPALLEQSLQPFTALHFKNRIVTYQARGLLAPDADALQLKLQPLRDLHSSPEVPTNYEQPPHNPQYSYILAGIACVVLLIGCINFTTLSVARSAARAREVGMRKAVGALKQQLMAQFWGEAMLVSLLALLLGLALVTLLLPYFNALTEKNLSLTDIGIGGGAALAGLTLLVGLVAGGYPAVVLSRFQPAQTLKGHITPGGAGLFMRSLVGIQFAISITLMICAAGIGQQLTFMKEKDLGYNGDQIVVFRARSGGTEETLTRYRNALSGYPDVIHVVGAGQAFSRSEDTRLWKDAEGNTRVAHVYGVDYDFVDMMEMKFAAGRNFSREFTSDPSAGVLVNETLVRTFGLDDPIGKSLPGFMPSMFTTPPVILGVVRDFNFKSLHQTIKPAILTMHPDYYARYRNIYVKTAGGNIPATLDLLKEKWRETAPDAPFDYFFLNEDVQRQYRNDEQWMLITRYSTVLAMAIACMGLLGLAALLVNRRTREIGVRKVLGASTPNLYSLLSREFVLLAAAAYVVAVPSGYYIMNDWLQDFAYRVDLGMGLFIPVGVLAFFSVLMTISYQVLKIVHADPVKALRHE